MHRPQGSGRQQLPGVTNYAYGEGYPWQWITGVPGFAQIHYTEVYAGIDLEYYGGKLIKYDWLVARGTQPGGIALHVRRRSPGLILMRRGDLE